MAIQWEKDKQRGRLAVSNSECALAAPAAVVCDTMCQNDSSDALPTGVRTTQTGDFELWSAFSKWFGTNLAMTSLSGIMTKTLDSSNFKPETS